MPPLHVQLLVLLAAFQNASAVHDGQSEPPPDRSRISLSIAPLMDLHQHVRAVAAGDAEPLPIDGFAEAVSAAGALEALVWPLIEGNILAAADAAEMLGICEQLPQVIAREEIEVPLRQPAIAYAEAILHLEAAFLRVHWPRRRETLEEAAASLNHTLLPHEQLCFEDLCRWYAMEDPHITIPVHLVTHAPSPGAITLRTRAGSQCIVAVVDLPPLQLAEIVLHEASHALDVATMRQPTALMQIRRSLQAAGIEPSNPKHRDIWHTIMFIQSAETIRRLIDADHVDYGDRSGYYNRVTRIVEVQRPLWRAYLDGETTLSETIDRIVTELSLEN